MNEKEISAGRVVSLNILLKDQHGEILADNLHGPPQVYRHGAGMILPMLEQYLSGMKVDEEAEFWIPCERAFGHHEPGLVLSISHEDLDTPETIRPGDQIRILKPCPKKESYSTPIIRWPARICTIMSG
jgi:FKBP-type peptidyl-prolyl cis-trans isomerase 2